MPIQSYKRPDGTWIVWNTDRSDAPPMDVGKAPEAQTLPSSAGGSQVAQQDTGAAGVSPYASGNFQFDRHDQASWRDMMKQFKNPDLSEDDKYNLVSKMLDRQYVSVDDNGDVWSAFPGKHGTQANEAFLDAMRKYADRQAGEQETPSSDQPTTTTPQLRSNLESQIGQAKDMTGQFQLGTQHGLGGEE